MAELVRTLYSYHSPNTADVDPLYTTNQWFSDDKSWLRSRFRQSIRYNCHGFPSLCLLVIT